jgi:hypothetical protein
VLAMLKGDKAEHVQVLYLYDRGLDLDDLGLDTVARQLRDTVIMVLN